MKTPYELFGDEGILSSGWAPFVQPLVDECREKGYEIMQIKEKWGTLRFYVCGVPDEFFDKIQAAEEKSLTTCYKCGKAGTFWGIGWVSTLCREHAIEQYGKEEVESYEADKAPRTGGHQEDDSEGVVRTEEGGHQG